MLARLSIRDIVLIERLDIEFSRGLAVLTGETGARKIHPARCLRDSRSAAAAIRRSGPARARSSGQVTASFRHRQRAIRRRGSLPRTASTTEGLKILRDLCRRVQLADGRTRAFINDQPVSVQALQSGRALALVEIHGQHDERGAGRCARRTATLLDAFAGLGDQEVACAGTTLSRRRGDAADQAPDAHRASMERAAREADYLRHAADELDEP